MPSSSVIIFLLIIITTTIEALSTWTARFEPNNVTLHVHESATVQLYLSGLHTVPVRVKQFDVSTNDDRLLGVEWNRANVTDIPETGDWNGSFVVHALFLGTPNVFVELVDPDGNAVEQSEQQLPVVVIRRDELIDHLFVASVATLVSILYINFGAALNVQKLRSIVVRPIGPIIGFGSQFIIMPLVCVVAKTFLIIFEFNFRSIYIVELLPGNRFISGQCEYAVGHVFYGHFTGRWCLEHLDRFVGRQHGFVRNDDGHQ